MEDSIKYIKIDNFINSVVLEPAGRKNIRTKITDRFSTTLMIKEVGKTLYKEDKKTYICSDKEVIFIPKGKTYSLVQKEEGNCYQINFDIEPELDKIKTFKVNGPYILELFKKIDFIYKSDPTNRLQIFSLLYNLLNELTVNVTSLNKYVLKAVEIIQKDLSNPLLDNDYIAKEINISEVYLRKLFLSQMNLGPKQFIIKQRMEKAYLLLSQGFSVKEISTLVGYESMYSFSRAFKNFYKKSPQKMRNT